MAIPVILKGDTSATLTFAIAGERDFTGCVLHIEIGTAVSRIISSVPASGTFTLKLTATETALLFPGTHRVRMTLIKAIDGERVSLPWGKIVVSLSPSEVYDASIDVQIPATEIEQVPERFNNTMLRDKLNEVISKIGGAAVAVLLSCTACADVLSVETAPMGEIYNDTAVVTNVTLDASGLATPATVSNIVTKSYVEALGISDAGTTNYADLANKPAVNGVTLSGNKTAEDLGLATLEEFSELGGEVVAKYTKPQAGIPASDMTPAVQDSLNKANTALQNAPVASVNGKTGVVALTASDVGAKPTQTPVSDPSYNEGFADEFISNITQNQNGVITPTKKKIDFSKVVGHTLPYRLPDEFFPVDVWFNGAGDFFSVVISDPALLTVVENQTGGGPYMLRYYNADVESPSEFWGYLDIAVFDAQLQFERLASAGTVDFGGYVPYRGDSVYLVAGGGGLAVLGTLVQSKLPFQAAPLASPALTGTPTAPTPAAADNSTKVATTAFVKTAISGISVTPLSGRTFDFATTQGVMDALKATIEALGGTVTNAPTASAQNNQTQGE